VSAGNVIHNAGMDRGACVIELGDEEVTSKNQTVTIRKKSEFIRKFREHRTTYALIAAVKKDAAGKPSRPLSTHPDDFL
jgi:hypothetical protein